MRLDDFFEEENKQKLVADIVMEQLKIDYHGNLDAGVRIYGSGDDVRDLKRLVLVCLTHDLKEEGAEIEWYGQDNPANEAKIQGLNPVRLILEKSKEEYINEGIEDVIECSDEDDVVAFDKFESKCRNSNVSFALTTNTIAKIRYDKRNSYFMQVREITGEGRFCPLFLFREDADEKDAEKVFMTNVPGRMKCIPCQHINYLFKKDEVYETMMNVVLGEGL